MQAGPMRQRVTIEQGTEVNNTFGEAVVNWTPLATGVSAKVAPLTGRELFNAQQVQPDVTHQVQLRYRTGLTSKLRLVFKGGRVLNVLSVRNVEERNRELLLLCMEPQ